MHKYIALLRGVNVGGKNSIAMPALKAAFAEDGFGEVSTYINSGNVIFSTEAADTELLQRRCEALIERVFHLRIAVAVLSAAQLAQALDNAPAWWGDDKQSKHNAIFVIPPATVDDVYMAVGEIKPAYEQVGHSGNVVFWSAPIKTFSRTRWSKVVGTSAYDSITIRNANTARKLAALSR